MAPQRTIARAGRAVVAKATNTTKATTKATRTSRILDRDEEGALRAEPDRLAPRRQCLECGREPAARGLDAPPDRRHRSGAERSGWRGGAPRRPPLARARVGRGSGAAERAAGAL